MPHVGNPGDVHFEDKPQETSSCKTSIKVETLVNMSCHVVLRLKSVNYTSETTKLLR